MDKAANILLHYIRDLLRHPLTAALDVESLSDDFRPLGTELAGLADHIREAYTFGLSLAAGTLSEAPPCKENILAEPIAKVQDSLLRLTRQAQKVAEGDYDQQVSYPDEFSDIFNTITNQLRSCIETAEMENQVLLDNIKALDDISWELEKSNLELRGNLALVKALTDFTHNMIFVYSLDTGQEIHTNRPAEWFKKANSAMAAQLIPHLLQKQPDISRMMAQQPPTGMLEDEPQSSVTWNMELDSPDGTESIFYQVESFLIPWFDNNFTGYYQAKKKAFVHIVMDETERKKRQNMMYRFVYTDPLTGLNNRRYAMEKMEQWLQEGTAYVFSFIDVDYLKYCNDTFGHEKGDAYLIQVSEALQSLGGEVCRVGGDEFFLFQTGITKEEQDGRLEELRRRLKEDKSSGYPKSFSYATSLIPAYTQIPLEVYISDTDTKMYQYKQTYKAPLQDVVYRDDRLL